MVIRGDLSNKLIHLTRSDDASNAQERFLAIYNSGTLLGSDRDVRGGFKCICFSEAPLTAIAQSIASSDSSVRYAPFGVMISKKWLFKNGGRPVIYQPESDYEQLNESNQYRHVRYDPINGPDYSWEREWRIRTDELKIDPLEATFIVPTRAWAKRFIDKHTTHAVLISSIVEMPVSSKMKQHFIALEDLGMEGFEEYLNE